MQNFWERSLQQDQIVVGTAVAVITYFIYWYKRTYSFWSSRGINGPTPLPFIGNALTYVLNPISVVDVKFEKKYGKLYGIYHGTDPVLIVSDPEIIEKIYVTHHSSFLNLIKSPTTDPMVMNAIVFKHGMTKDWKVARNVFTAGLTPSKLKESFELAIKSRDLIKHIESNENNELDGIRLFTTYILNTIVQEFFGLDFDLFNNSDHEIISHSMKLLQDFNILPFLLSQCIPSFLYKSPATIPATNYLSKVASFAMKEREKLVGKMKGPEHGSKPRNDYLQLIMDSEMTPMEKLSNLSFQLFQASTDTIPLVIAHALDELGRNQHAMVRLQYEIDTLLNVVDVDGKVRKREMSEITIEEVQSLKYLEWCLWEAIRLRPTASRAFRLSSEETKIPTTDVTIPSNLSIQVAIVPLHHDPDSFQDPNTFNPDRWSDDGRVTMKKCSLLTFGAGPRQCPARQFSLIHAKIAVISVLRNYDVEVSSNSEKSKLSAGNYVYEASSSIKFIPRK